jgi:excinuclease ABC subunit B
VTVPVQEEAPIPPHELPELIESLRQEMREAARDLAYERAAELRDRIQELEAERLRIA